MIKNLHRLALPILTTGLLVMNRYLHTSAISGFVVLTTVQLILHYFLLKTIT
jgi:hypothetical protein